MTRGLLLGGVEAGGTRFICAVGRLNGPGVPAIVARTILPTTAPAETLTQAARWFEARGPIAALGVASFGPADVDPDSPTWGRILETPKPRWSGIDIAGILARRLGSPVGFDTDVGGALLAESRWGAAQDCPDCIYMTVGTGIGGAALSGGRPLRGRGHPEMGHMTIGRDPGDSWPGCCPFHGACLEGLASGPAIAARWGAPGESLPDAHPAWSLTATYLGRGLANLALTLSPRRIVIGGGVMRRAGMLSRVRASLETALAGYAPAPEVIAPGLSEDAGVMGALLLAAGVV